MKVNVDSILINYAYLIQENFGLIQKIHDHLIFITVFSLE